jgi:hypothetical protein
MKYIFMVYLFAVVQVDIVFYTLYSKLQDVFCFFGYITFTMYLDLGYI